MGYTRQTGYRYEVDLSMALADVKALFEYFSKEKIDEFPVEIMDNQLNRTEAYQYLTSITDIIRQIIASQDKQGRWIVKQDKFRKGTPGYDWQGEYRYEDRISSALFNQNVETLCFFLEVYKQIE